MQLFRTPPSRTKVVSDKLIRNGDLRVYGERLHHIPQGRSVTQFRLKPKGQNQCLWDWPFLSVQQLLGLLEGVYMVKKRSGQVKAESFFKMLILLLRVTPKSPAK